MGKFHWSRGISFERVTAVGLEAAKAEGILPRDNHEVAPGDVRLYVGSHDVQGFIVPASEWASIIASVSDAGETAEKYAEAQRFHAGAS